MEASNSISHILEQFLELNTNALETFERINEAITTDKQTVTIDLFNSDTNKTSKIQIPAFGFLKREIERLDKNISSISGLDSSSAHVRLKDGSYRRIHTARLNGPSKSVKTLNTPTEFSTKLNEFFEDFLNPLLTVSLDVTGQLPTDIERVYIERFIFDDKDANSVQLFDELYKGSNSIKHDSFLKELKLKKAKYIVDGSIEDMPTRDVQYKGHFDVVKIDNAQKTKVINGVSGSSTVKLFKLNKLSYSDASKSMNDTEVLKVNDSLIVNSGSLSTRYKITSIDSSKTQVELQLMEGYEGIKIGANQLSVYKDIDTDLDIEVKVGFNERQVVFVQPIDPISKIKAEEYSPGIAFFSNELKMQVDNGDVFTLAEYYKNEVSDFGQFIKSLKVDFIPPAVDGIIPTKPVLLSSNFKVVQINKHLTNNTTTDKLKKLKADKLNSEQRLSELADAIAGQKQKMYAKTELMKLAKTDRLNVFVKRKLAELIEERNAESKLYASIIREINAIGESSSVTVAKPKYRARGFWAIPDAKKVGEGVTQEVVQFSVRYRYISTTGKTSTVDQIEFIDDTNNTTKTGAFSNWVELKTPARKRKLNKSGVFEWVIESEEDSQVVNFNALDIPIQFGENVEVQIKSISEAGWPTTPIESEYSDILKVTFPDGEIETDNMKDVVGQNKLDSVKIEIKSDLEAAGLYDHLGGSFNSNEKYFAHSASDLASGFLTAEQTPISIYDKLLDLQTQIAKLTGDIEKTVGELQVNIIDESGNKTVVNNNTTVKLFAGYYTEEIPIDNKKGAIITKGYKIELSNNKATELELIARIMGDTNLPAYSSDTTPFGTGSTIDNAIIGSTYYTTEGKYDQVPLMYQNLTDSQTNFVKHLNHVPYQSSQLRGQFAYSRFRNLANDGDLYINDINLLGTVTNWSEKNGVDITEYGINYTSVDPTTDANGFRNFGGNAFTPYNDGGSVISDFIWAGDYDVNNAPNISALSDITDYDNGILLHTSHPHVVANKTTLEIRDGGLVSMPRAATLTSSVDNGKKQCAFKSLTTYTDGVADSGPQSSTGVYINRNSVKNSFTSDDRYLLGGKSCGAFLYVAPIDTLSLIVDSPNKFGKRRIKNGDGQSLSLDLIFQYRMTDYFGVGNEGIGKVGGLSTNPISNYSYSKKIGIDILDSGKNSFQFDIEVYSKYRPEGTKSNAFLVLSD